MITWESIHSDWEAADPNWPAAEQWLRNNYLPAQEVKIAYILKVLSAIREIPYSVPNMTLELHLKSAPWNGLSGEFIPNYLPSLIKIYWQRETDPTDVLYARIVAHEVIHAVTFSLGLGDMMNSGHGNSQDWMVQMLNYFIDRAWPVGHWSHPGNLPR